MCILRLRGRWPLAALISFLFIFWSPLPALGQTSASASVALAWDASADPGVIGYYLYYGGSSRAYTNRVSVGNMTTATISGLIPGGTYYFTATAYNAAGLESDYSNEATYTVPVSALPPTITSQPAGQTVTAGSSVTFTVAASGTAPFTYQWKKDGVNISGANTASLTLNSVSSANAGSYTVVVSNSAGSVASSAAVLTVNALVAAPVITTQPTSQTVTAGDSVTFSVTVTGNSPISYQWRKAGAVIPGATGSSFSLNNVQASNAGTYWVTVSNPSGSVTSASATLTVQPAPTVEFAAGTYSGLFSDPRGVSTLSSGSLTLKVNINGKFSAKLVRGRQRSSMSGQFDAKGKAQKTLLVANQQPLTVSLLLSPDDPEHITGTVSDGTFNATLLADRAGFNGVAKIAPQAGRYTLVINGTEETSAAIPRGYSAGAITVNGAGAIRLAASLADGTKISQSVSLSANGDWPLFASLYSGSGSIMSWAKFDSSKSGGIGGDVVWIKPALPKAKLYPAGFSFTTLMQGSPYRVGAKALSLASAKLTLADGNLSAQIVNQIVLAPGNRVANLSDNKLSLKFSPSTGLFTGRVTDPTTSKTIPFSGAVLQNESAGFGWFSGLSGQSGVVTITGD